MATVEEICSRLCLLTRAAWEDALPPVMTRLAVSRLIDAGALTGLTIRDTDEIPEAMRNRARMLLSRSAAVYDCLNEYEKCGYRVVLPEEEDWPLQMRRLKESLRPHFLFMKGCAELLGGRLIAFAGSRDIQRETYACAYELGRKAAEEGLTIVSGGARGVDTAVQRGALENGGKLILVPAQPVQRILRDEMLAHALAQGRLLLLCDALPDERFSAQRAIARNHVIYAMGEAAVVVAARAGIGGSWHGAMDCLRGAYTRVWTIDGDAADYEGNRGLLQAGAFALDLKDSLSSQCFAEAGCDQISLFDQLQIDNK